MLKIVITNLGWIDSWLAFLKTEKAKKCVPKWNNCLIEVLAGLNTKQNENSNLNSDFQIDNWTKISSENQNNISNLELLSNNKADYWQFDRKKFDNLTIKSFHNWINNLKKNNSNDNSSNTRPFVDSKSLNKLQKRAYNLIQRNLKKNNQLLLRIEGEGGTGKSHLINAICSTYSKQDPIKKMIILLVAPTGRAAHNIGAETIHSFFGIPIKSFEQLSPGTSLKKLQTKIENCKAIMCDEFSQVGCKLFDAFERRCRQATGKTHELFGGLSIILVGDTRQIPPVLDRCLWNKIKKGEKSSNAIKNAQFAFNSFKKVIRLEQNHRQSDPEQEKFRQLLKRLRVCKSTLDDWNTLRPRIMGIATNELEFENAIYLTYTNPDCDAYNKEKIANIHQNNPNELICHIDAEHCGSLIAQSFPSSLFGSLSASLKLIRGAKIMITNNLWTEFGITNGSFGILTHIIYEHNKQPPSLPSSIIVKMDNDYIGPHIKDYPKHIVINPITHFYQDKKNTYQRTQLPIEVAFAITIHKCQGNYQF
jgi:ATP-dependent DNA helicase PIF1